MKFLTRWQSGNRCRPEFEDAARTSSFCWQQIRRPALTRLDGTRRPYTRLKVFYPATPTDAKGMLNLALNGTDPVVFFESQKTYGIGEQFETAGVPEGYYETEQGQPIVRREGTDLTLITSAPFSTAV